MAYDNQPNPQYGLGDFLADINAGLQQVLKAAWDEPSLVGALPDAVFPYDHFVGWDEGYAELQQEAQSRATTAHTVKPTWLDNTLLQDSAQQLKTGRELEDKHIRHLAHLNELVTAQADRQDTQPAAAAFRHHVMMAVVGNQITNTPVDEEGQANYRGEFVPEALLPEVVKADTAALIDTGKRLGKKALEQVIQDTLSQPERVGPRAIGRRVARHIEPPADLAAGQAAGADARPLETQTVGLVIGARVPSVNIDRITDPVMITPANTQLLRQYQQLIERFLGNDFLQPKNGLSRMKKRGLGTYRLKPLGEACVLSIGYCSIKTGLSSCPVSGSNSAP